MAPRGHEGLDGWAMGTKGFCKKGGQWRRGVWGEEGPQIHGDGGLGAKGNVRKWGWSEVWVLREVEEGLTEYGNGEGWEGMIGTCLCSELIGRVGGQGSVHLLVKGMVGSDEI